MLSVRRPVNRSNRLKIAHLLYARIWTLIGDKRSKIDLPIFIVLNLRRYNKLWLLFWGGNLLQSFLGFLLAVPLGGWTLLSSALSIALMAYDVLEIYHPRNLKIKTDSRLPKVLNEIKPPRDDPTYVISAVPNRKRRGIDELVLRSDTIDKLLQSGLDPALAKQPSYRTRAGQLFLQNGDIFEAALADQYCRSLERSEKFINEAKVCLATDLSTHDFEAHPIGIYRSNYYTGWLTNELCTATISLNVGSARYRGHEHFPFENEDGAKRLMEIWDASQHGTRYVSGHIGASTLLHTCDKYLIVWEQGRSAGQSQCLAAPTGSGSCDWADWKSLRKHGRTLRPLVIRAMEREFREESHRRIGGLQDKRIDTRMIGFFRWVTRGGKPEFIGISRADVYFDELQANKTEVELDWITNYPAASIREIHEVVAKINAQGRASVPLWVLLDSLDKYAAREPESLAKFLDIPIE
jgi:hypothetical protein